MTEAQTRICSLKDNKQAAVTFTTDDGIYSSCLAYQALFKKLGLRGTLCLTLNFIQGDGEPQPEDSFSRGTWEQWKAFVAEGCFDVANHSISHAFLDKLSPEELEAEINDSRRILMAQFPGNRVLCMANPYIVTNEAIDNVIRQQHYAARNGAVGDYNTLDPDDQEWYHLKTQLAMHDTTAETMNGWVDEAIRQEKWLVEVWHGIDGEGWEPPSYEAFSKHMTYLASQLDKVWNGSLDEVTAYVRERQHAHITTRLENEQTIRVRLDTDLDPTLFQFPLTLQTTLPQNWHRVSVSQGDSMLDAKAFGSQEGTYLQYEAVPNHGEILIRKGD